MAYLKGEYDLNWQHLIFFTDLEHDASGNEAAAAIYRNKNPEATGYNDFDLDALRKHFGNPSRNEAIVALVSAMARGAAGTVRIWGTPHPGGDTTAWVKFVYPILKAKLDAKEITGIFYMDKGATSPDMTAFRETKDKGLVEYHRKPPGHAYANNPDYWDVGDGRLWIDGLYYEHSQARGGKLTRSNNQKGPSITLSMSDQVSDLESPSRPHRPKGPAKPLAHPDLPSASNGKPSHPAPKSKPGMLRLPIWRPP